MRWSWRIACGLCFLCGCASAASPFSDPATITYAPALQVDLAAARLHQSGIYIQDTRIGNGAEARVRSQVQLHYTLHLPDGKEVQTTRNSQPLGVTLDDPRFLIGVAIVGMRVGGVRKLVVAPNRGYGSAGVPGLVPPNTTLVFDVELIAVQ
ncbi:MAG: FKBP-type peptidyl-prolyl cis-trans isomerase [Gemmatimonadota bacterium]